MNVLIALTYYRPHYSGLTIYAERLARALAARGHAVTILTSRYAPELPAYQELDGVEIYRLNILMRISKGVIMPAMPLRAWQFARQADVVNLHVPQLDAAPISALARLRRKPVVLTYHCDLQLPRGFVHRLANQVSHLANHVSAGLSNVIVTNTRDYAEQSPFLRHYLGKVHVIPPPVTLPEVSPQALQTFRNKYDIQPGQRIIGVAARLAAEKGIEYLVAAMPQVLQAHPDARVLFVGQYQDVMGEEAYAHKLAPSIEGLGVHWAFLGVLPPLEFAAFMHVADVTVLPSINSTESFGMVQIESMTCGTPVIASDMPGVRQPVRTTGMGQVVPPRDVDRLARALIDVLDQPAVYQGDVAAIKRQYNPDSVAGMYEQLFQRLTGQE
jgi:glycosyltransferase involved in cell wall biosynthesis